ncbi:MAG: DUF6785 family protein [Nitrososphaerales archaeon]
MELDIDISANTKSSKQPGLTPRVLLLTLLLAPANAYILVEMEVVRYTYPTWIVPLANVIFTLMVVVTLNHLIRRLAPRIALRQDELLVLYVMLSLVTTMMGVDILQPVISVLGHAFWFATVENDFKDLFWEHLPEWLTVNDTRALRGYYEGESSIYLAENLKVWIPVVIAWLLLFVVLGFIFLCLNVILRRQWTQRERLTYPITQLPMEMTHPVSGFFRNKRMWIGFAIAASISLLNGISFLYPSTPSIPVTRRSFEFADRPFSFYGGMTLAFYPFAIGLMFLMPLDVLFSTAFFYGLYRNQRAMGEAMGWRSSADFPYLNEQAIGAFIALGICLFWIGRQHFMAVIRSAFKLEAELDDSQEPLPYRVAFWGLVLGLILFAFLLHVAGMAFWLACTFAVLFLITPIITTRIRAESGIFVHAYHHQAPRYMLIDALGTRRLGTQNLTALSVCFFNRDYRPQQMPHQLEAFKIAEQVNISPRRMVAAILVAVALGVILGFWVQLHYFYKFGADSGYFNDWSTGYGRQFFGRLRNWIYRPTSTEPTKLLFMGIGFTVMVLLVCMRIRFFWLPLHPLGYAMASNQEMSDLWAPMLISLFFKWLILKYGGVRGYRRAVPFFLGLVLGDYLMGITFSLLSIALNVRMYQFYP